MKTLTELKIQRLRTERQKTQAYIFVESTCGMDPLMSKAWWLEIRRRWIAKNIFRYPQISRASKRLVQEFKNETR